MKSPIDQITNFWKNPRYEYCYLMIDVHNTIFKPTFSKEENFQYFQYAKQCLQLLSKHPKTKLILWTGCYPDQIEIYLKHFDENEIHFDYVNENPECENTSYACLDKKFYFDIGFDDKFGFEGSKEWRLLYPVLLSILK